MTPKNTRLKKKQKYKNIEQKLKNISFNKHAVNSGFIQRKDKKITGKLLLLIAFILMAMHGKNSFQHWAEQVSVLTGKTVSKQGVWKRMTLRLTAFLALILFDVLKQQTSTTHEQAKNCYISLFKLCKYIANNIDLFFENNLNVMMLQILYYCRYVMRNDRQNFVRKLKLGCRLCDLSG